MPSSRPPRRGGSKKAIVYVRQSTKKEESISPATQRGHCEDYARKMGYEIVDVVEDLDLSGRDFRKRGVGRIIERVAEGEAVVVIVWKWSRWGRNLIESLLCIAELKQVHGALESATEPIDSSTAAGKFSVTQMLAIAEFESDRIGDSWRDARRAMVLKRGLPPTGGKRIGYHYETGKRIYRTHDTIGPAMAQAYEYYSSGMKTAKVLRWLRNDFNVTSTYGNPLTEQALLEYFDSGFAAGLIILKHPERILTDDELDQLDAEPGETLYLPGQHRDNNGEMVASWSPLIETEQWMAYRTERARRKPIAPRARNASRPMSQLLRCAACGRSLTFLKREEGQSRWGCSNRDLKGGPDCEARVSITEESVHDAVKDWLQKHVDGDSSVAEALVRRQLEATSAKADVKALEKELARQQQRRSNLLDLAADGDLSRDEIKPKTREIRQEIDRLQEAITAANRRAAVTTLPEARSFGATLRGFNRMDSSILNRALKELIGTVWIYPQNQKPRVLIQGTWQLNDPVPVAEPIEKDLRDGRTCLRCREWKPADQFYRRRRGDLLQHCIPCKAHMHQEAKASREGQQISA